MERRTVTWTLLWAYRFYALFYYGQVHLRTTIRRLGGPVVSVLYKLLVSVAWSLSQLNIHSATDSHNDFRQRFNIRLGCTKINNAGAEHVLAVDNSVRNGSLASTLQSIEQRLVKRIQLFTRRRLALRIWRACHPPQGTHRQGARERPIIWVSAY